MTSYKNEIKAMVFGLFFYLIDTIVTNSWRLIEIGVTETTMNQKKFRADFVLTLCEAVPEVKKRDRPSNSEAIESKRLKRSLLPPKNLRLDCFNYWLVWNEKSTY